MPSMGKIEFKHTNEAGEVMQFSTEASVNAQGVFAINLPEELAEVAKALQIPVSCPRTKWRVESDSLERAKSYIRQAIAEYLKVEVRTERFIVYSTDIKASFWQNPDGTIAPNGSYRVGVPREDGGEWGTIGGLHATNTTSHYSVGLWARVMDRTETRRGVACKVNYRLADFGNSKPAGDESHWGYLLNSFTALAWRDGDLDRMTRMPYTEEAAQFFYTSLEGICLLARGIDSYFKSPEKLQQAIAGQVRLLGSPQ